VTVSRVDLARDDDVAAWIRGVGDQGGIDHLVNAAGVQTYGESASREGSIGHLRGPEIMPNLVALAKA
jgi:short-subunit dehydrogenase